ncbi:50S ribosomal protein L23, partial [Staphylococcus epidermidis]|uniref:50S ribosomal protein L23 n=1 Tax=Staphylococcus epidermidis TaxID=1282 RepID=UPI0037D9DDDF
MIQPTHLLNPPLITQKSSQAIPQHKYTFHLHTPPNKTQLKIPLQQIFHVKLHTLNIINYKPNKK